jgi:hypothetical protein
MKRGGRGWISGGPAEAGSGIRGIPVPAEAGPVFPGGYAVPTEAGIEGPAGRWFRAAEAGGSTGTGRQRLQAGLFRRPLPKRATEVAVRHPRPKRARVPPRWERSREDRVLVLVRLRSAEADPHITEVVQDSKGAGRLDRSRVVRTLSRAGVRGVLPRLPLPGTRGGRPPGERPSSRPCSTDESVAAYCRCQQSTARVSHGLVSPSRSSRFRCWSPVAFRRSVGFPVVAVRAEARAVSWASTSRRSPGARWVGPLSCGEPQGGSAASLRGLLASGRCGIAPVRFLKCCPRSLSGSESCEAFVVRSRTVTGRSLAACFSPASMGFSTSKNTSEEVFPRSGSDCQQLD